MLSRGGNPRCPSGGVWLVSAHLLCSAPSCSLVLARAEEARLQRAVRASGGTARLPSLTRRTGGSRGFQCSLGDIHSLGYSLLCVSLDQVHPTSYTSATGFTKTFPHSGSCSNLASWAKHVLSTRHVCEIPLNSVGVGDRFKSSIRLRTLHTHGL